MYFIKGTSNNPLLFYIVLRIYKVKVKGELILHIVHIVVPIMIEAGIYGLFRGNNLGGMMRGLDLLKIVLLGRGATEISEKFEPWISSWWGDTLTPLETMGWFEEDKKRYNLLWDPSLSVMKTALDLLLEDRLKRPFKNT